MSWVFTAYVLVNAVLSIVCLFSQENYYSTGRIVGLSVLTLIFTFSFLGMVVATAIVTRSDPTDPTIALVRDMDQRLRDDLNDRITRIAQFYCNICETNVMKYTKHCALCNRCCFEFDHHCRWVNNDIGRMNYI